MVPFSASIANTSGYAALFASGAPFPLPAYLLPQTGISTRSLLANARIVFSIP